jgi:hypothetical protein
MLTEWHTNLEHHSRGVIYDRNMLIVQVAGLNKLERLSLTSLNSLV